jgi:hypothetical protein
MSDVLGSQFKAMLCGLNCPPLPASAMESAPALLLTVIDPVVLPAAVGAKVTFKTAVCPGVSVVFTLAPFAVNAAPATTRLKSVTFAFPELVSVACKELLLPITTLPKSKFVVLEVNEAAGATPLPLATIISGDPGASLISETDPLTLPADCGAKTTLNVAVWLGGILIGRANPDVLNPAPITLAAESVTTPVPLFCKVTVCELLDPVVTLEKLVLIGEAARPGVAGVGVPGPPLPLGAEFDPITTPAHPLPTNAAASTIATMYFRTFSESDH